MQNFLDPEHLRAGSDFVHMVEGTLLSVAALMALGEVKSPSSWFRWGWPLVLCLTGFFLPLYMFLHRGFSKADSQQVQLLVIAGLICVAGLYEMVSHSREEMETWGCVSGLLFVVIGALFCVHTQHGSEGAMRYALLFHRILGSVFILSGLSKFMYALSRKAYLGYVWGFMLLMAGFLLASYREPKGAYEPQKVTITSEEIQQLMQR
ncbi:MAG: hypothetical protein HY400_05930 [Elusimicrobia bacterium]|nr:hypothetical protein [Elusimicrobiota bacterium]